MLVILCLPASIKQSYICEMLNNMMARSPTTISVSPSHPKSGRRGGGGGAVHQNFFGLIIDIFHDMRNRYPLTYIILDQYKYGTNLLSKDLFSYQDNDEVPAEAAVVKPQIPHYVCTGNTVMQWIVLILTAYITIRLWSCFWNNFLVQMRKAPH